MKRTVVASYPPATPPTVYEIEMLTVVGWQPFMETRGAEWGLAVPEQYVRMIDAKAMAQHLAETKYLQTRVIEVTA
jgi:hypothetical protein